MSTLMFVGKIINTTNFQQTNSVRFWWFWLVRSGCRPSGKLQPTRWFCFFSFSSVCQTQRSPVNGDDGFVFLIFEFLSMVDEALSWEVFFFFFLHLERERFLLTDIC